MADEGELEAANERIAVLEAALAERDELIATLHKRVFYLDFLELAVDWEHRFEPDLPLYMQVSRQDCAPHLSEHFGDGSPGACSFLPMQGVREYQALLTAKSYKHARPGIYGQPWGWIEMHLADPFGNKLRFAERKPEEP